MINWKVTHKENVNSRNDGRRPFKSDLLYGESAQCWTRECTEIQRSPTINLCMNDVFHVNFSMEIRYTRFKGDFVIFIVILLSRSKSEVENKGRNDDFCLVSPFTSCFPFNTVADCCITLYLADLWIDNTSWSSKKIDSGSLTLKQMQIEKHPKLRRMFWRNLHSRAIWKKVIKIRMNQGGFSLDDIKTTLECGNVESTCCDSEDWQGNPNYKQVSGKKQASLSILKR